MQNLLTWVWFWELPGQKVKVSSWWWFFKCYKSPHPTSLTTYAQTFIHFVIDEMTQEVRILTAPTCGSKFQSQNPHHTSLPRHLNTSSQTCTLCANTHTQSREKLKSKINKYIIKVHMYTLKQIIFYDKLC